MNNTVLEDVRLPPFLLYPKIHALSKTFSISRFPFQISRFQLPWNPTPVEYKQEQAHGYRQN